MGSLLSLVSTCAVMFTIFDCLGLGFHRVASYVFDPEFGEDNLGRRLLGDYAVPK